MLRRKAMSGRTDEELQRMRAAGLVVAKALSAVREAAAPGKTTADLDAIAHDVIRGEHARPAFLGYQGFPASICTSVNDEVVHGIPGERVLEPGDLLSVDCGAELDGWYGDSAISLIVGGEDAARDPKHVALLKDTYRAMWAGIVAFQVGGRLNDVGAAVEGTLHVEEQQKRPNGPYGVIEDYVGHGIGDAMHLPPDVPNVAQKRRGPVIGDGATVAIEPMVTLGTIETDVLEDDWTVVTTDGSWAAHWEHTVAATRKGLWVLTAEDGGAEVLGELGCPCAAPA